MLRSETAFLRTVSISATLPGRALASPKRRFWLIVGLITLGGAILRLLTHDYGLPYIEYTDELWMWLAGQRARGLPWPDSMPAGPHPPLTLWLHVLAQLHAEAQGRFLAGDAILDLRRLVLVLNVAGTGFIALLTRNCAGTFGGIAAAILWAFHPVMLDIPTHAIGDSLVYPLFILCLLLAVLALDPSRPWQLALASLVTALPAFLLDYRLLLALFPGLAALVLRNRPLSRSRWRRTLLLTGVGGILLGIAAAVLPFLLPELFLTILNDTVSTYMWDFAGIRANFRVAFQHLGEDHLLIFAFFAMTGLLAILTWWRAGKSGGRALIMKPTVLVAATLLAYVWATSAIRPYGYEGSGVPVRHVIPAITLVFVLLAAALAQIMSSIRKRHGQTAVKVLLAVSVALALAPPSLTLTRQRLVPPWPVIVLPWLNDNLTSGRILITEESNHWFRRLYGPKTQRIVFDHLWGGIPHRADLDWLETIDVLERPLHEWTDSYGITWLILPLTRRQRLQQDERGRDFLASLLHLRDFSEPPWRPGVEVALYRLWRMQLETDVRFGNHIRLSGFDLHSPHLQPGQDLDLTLYWNATTTPAAKHSFLLHLVGADDPRPLAQLDGNPAIPARPTQTWDRPEETLISPRFSLPLPDELPPGDYRVILGLYNFETGERLPVRDASGAPLGDAWELLRLNLTDSRTVNVREAARAA